jgi:hypothetical protein
MHNCAPLPRFDAPDEQLAIALEDFVAVRPQEHIAQLLQNAVVAFTLRRVRR